MNIKDFPTHETMIQLFHVYKNFGGNLALRDVNIQVQKGEFVFITGPSGAGKTTLLRIIFGAEKASSGHILINGINLGRIRRKDLDLLRRRIGFVFQDFKLLTNKTIFENVAMALEVTGAKPSYIRKKTQQTLRSLGLGKKAKAYPLQLSGGEQQRVAIARAVVKNPLILLADEPTGNLDPDLTREIMVLFRAIHMKGTTVVVATHNRELLRGTAIRKIYLEKGRIIKEE